METMKQKIITNSPEETVRFGKEYARSLKEGDVVLLCGEMGAGKTWFAKGVAQGLGITELVTSPTFAIHNIYEGKTTLHHFDFYRITAEEAAILGLSEFFGKGVCLVEWAQNVAELLPKGCKEVSIEKTGDETREITYERFDD